MSQENNPIAEMEAHLSSQRQQEVYIHKMSAKAILEISNHESQIYNLKNSDRLSEICALGLGLSLEKDISSVAISPKGDALVFGLKGRPDLTVMMDDEETMPKQIMERFFTLLIHGAPIWKCLINQPLWYRYWVFRYLETKSLDDMELVPRLSPEDISTDFAITAIVPTQISKGTHENVVVPDNVIQRRHFNQTHQDDPFNIAVGEIFPFVVIGNKYGFNQTIPVPHVQERVVAKEDFERVLSTPEEALWVM